MADSIRQQIISALTTLLATITVVNGYETGLGANVFEWKTSDWQESEIPGVDIRDTDESGVIRGGNHEKSLTIELEAKVSGTTSPDIVRDVIADIEKALGTVYGTSSGLGPLVQGIEPVQNTSMGFDQKDKTFGSILLNFQLRYLTEAFKPFDLA